MDSDNDGTWYYYKLQDTAGSERLLQNAEMYGIYFAAALMDSNVNISQDVQNSTITRTNMGEYSEADHLIIIQSSVDPLQTVITYSVLFHCNKNTSSCQQNRKRIELIGNTLCVDTVLRADPVDSKNIADITFPENIDIKRFGDVQSKLPRSFLIEYGAESNHG